MDDDLRKCAEQLDYLTAGFDKSRRRRFLTTLPSIADNIFKTVQVIGPDPIESAGSASGSSGMSTVSCPHCGTPLSVRVAK